MATMNVSLPDAMKKWVDSQAETGEYRNASDYVRDLIRRDQRRRQALALMQDAVTEGVESGAARPVDENAFLLRMHDRHVVK